MSYGLRYQAGGDLDQMTIMVDASYAPPHEQYRSIQGLMVLHGHNLIMWQSSRQPFITQSTAEAELMGYTEGLQAGLSTVALLQTLGFEVKAKTLKGDSKAALAICTMETGPWRTRHLRLRASKIRELLATPEERWYAVHCPGESLTADGLTKGLLGQAFRRFRSRLSLVDTSEGAGVGVESHPADGLDTSRVVAACALAATAGVLLQHGRKVAGGAVALCALMIGGRELKKRQKKSQEEEPTRSGKAKIDVQDGRQIVCRATLESTSQDDIRSRNTISGSSDRDRTVPGIRAVRLGPVSESHGSAQQPIPPGVQGRAAGGYQRGGAIDRGAAALAGSSDDVPGIEASEFERPGEIEPWNMQQFQIIGKGKDAWDLSLWTAGWLVRRHPVERSRSFHPVHQTLPCSTRELRGSRVTVLVKKNGERHVRKDSWEDARGWAEELPWKGWTFFRRQGYETMVFDFPKESMKRKIMRGFGGGLLKMMGPMKPREVRSMNLDRYNTRAGDAGRGSVKGVRSRLEESRPTQAFCGSEKGRITMNYRLLRCWD